MFGLTTIVFDLLFARICNIPISKDSGLVRTSDLRCLSKLLMAIQRYLRAHSSLSGAELTCATHVTATAIGAATRHLEAIAALLRADQTRPITTRDFAAIGVLERATKIVELLKQLAPDLDAARPPATAVQPPRDDSMLTEQTDDELPAIVAAPDSSIAPPRRIPPAIETNPAHTAKPTKRDLKRADRKARRAAERNPFPALALHTPSPR